MRTTASLVCAALVAAAPSEAQESSPPAEPASPPWTLSTGTGTGESPDTGTFDLPHDAPDRRTWSDDLTGHSSATWTDAQGFRWGVSSGGVEPAAAGLSFRPKVATDPAWRFNASVTREGPGGLKFTGTVGGRRGYMLPSFLTDIVGSDTPVELAGMQLLDPYQPDTVWDATFRVERGFDAGPMEIRLVGEALVSFGRTPDLTSGNSSGSQLQWREDPQRLTGGAARLGLVLGF